MRELELIFTHADPGRLFADALGLALLGAAILSLLFVPVAG